jgi:hypothetical protein
MDVKVIMEHMEILHIFNTLRRLLRPTGAGEFDKNAVLSASLHFLWSVNEPAFRTLVQVQDFRWIISYRANGRISPNSASNYHIDFKKIQTPTRD